MRKADYRGNIDLAIESLRDAADVEEALPYSYGPPEIVKPAAELLGEVLVEEGDAEGEREAFARALTRVPGRRLSERGVPDEKRAQGDDETF